MRVYKSFEFIGKIDLMKDDEKGLTDVVSKTNLTWKGKGLTLNIKTDNARPY